MKLYVITRADLPPGAQCAQACHALRLFVEEHPAVDKYWYLKSNNLVVLQMPNEVCLEELVERAKKAGVLHSAFHEPDFDGALTAVALEPEGQKLVSSLPLALRAA